MFIFKFLSWPFRHISDVRLAHYYLPLSCRLYEVWYGGSVLPHVGLLFVFPISEPYYVFVSEIILCSFLVILL